MINTPKSLRIQIGIFGRTNVGKSSFLNMLANQEIALTSEIPGTTTDVVEKHMELLPIGPVTLHDTGGIDDKTNLSNGRRNKANKVMDIVDVAVIVTETNKWTHYEQNLVKVFNDHNTPFVIVVNKIDISKPSIQFLKSLWNYTKNVILVSTISESNRNKYIESFKGGLLKCLPSGYIFEKPLLGDLVAKYGLCVMIVPIDNEAPKGRIILPQVQAIRDALDNDAMSLIVKDTEYKVALEKLSNDPNIVICDSQVVDKMVAETPPNVLCTTFSILFARYKGDLFEEVKGLDALRDLTPDDHILIAEACSHHPNSDDIGRVKIPGWLEDHLGFLPKIEFSAGRDYPDNLRDYKLVIHCGGCMLTRNEKQVRIEKAKLMGVPITNYGILISHLHGVLERVLSPFPKALDLYKQIISSGSTDPFLV